MLSKKLNTNVLKNLKKVFNFLDNMRGYLPSALSQHEFKFFLVRAREALGKWRKTEKDREAREERERQRERERDRDRSLDRRRR